MNVYKRVYKDVRLKECESLNDMIADVTVTEKDDGTHVLEITISDIIELPYDLRESNDVVHDPSYC